MKLSHLLVSVLIALSSLSQCLLAYDNNSFTASNDRDIAKLWLSCVKKSDMKGAIKAANKLVGDSQNIAYDSKKYENYRNRFLNRGLNPNLLIAEFNKWDYLLWHESYRMKELAESITEDCVSNTQTVEKLLSSVDNHLKSGGGPIRGYIQTPYIVWLRGDAFCDGFAWVYCELAYQLGFETQIIYIMQNQTNTSIHTFCEVRKGEMVWLVDPYFNCYLQNTSLFDLINNESLQFSLWKSEPEFRNNVINGVLFTNSFPQDYCIRNQILYKKLSKHLGKECPKFGEDPIERMYKYVLLTELDGQQEIDLNKFALWNVPLTVLSWNMNMGAIYNRILDFILLFNNKEDAQKTYIVPNYY